MKLYEINQQIENFIFIEDEVTGEILNFEELSALEMERDEKLESIALWIKNLESDEKQLKEESKNLLDRAEKKRKKAQQLKDFISKELGFNKFETTKVVVSFRSTTSTKVLDEALIPKQYMSTKVSETPNKAEIKKALQRGEEVAGCVLDKKKSISIK